MKRSLSVGMAIATCLTTSSIFAQTKQREVKPIAGKIVPIRKSNNSMRMEAGCGPDAANYQLTKIAKFGKDSTIYFEMWPQEQTSTAFALNTSTTITGAYVYGKVKQGDTGPATMQVSIWNVDKNWKPTTMIPGATATLSIAATGANALPVHHRFTFANPVSVSDSFAIVLTNKDTGTDDFWPVGSDGKAKANPQLKEGLTYYDWQGFWEPMTEVYSQIGEAVMSPIINYEVTPNFTVSNTNVCVNTPIKFTNTSNNLYKNKFFNQHVFDNYFLNEMDSTFRWNFGDNSPVVYGNAPEHTFTKEGTYTVVLTAEMKGYLTTCKNTKTITITVGGGIDAQVTSDGATSFCQGDSVKLNATPAVAASYKWLLDGKVIEQANLSHYYAALSGDYQVVVNGTCGSDTSSPIHVTKTEIKAIVSPAVSAISCDGSNVTLHATPVEGSTYQWLKNSTPIEDATSKQYIANVTADYAIIVSHTCGIDTSKTIPVQILSPVSLSASQLKICHGENTDLTVFAPNNSNPQWFFNDSPITSASGLTYKADLSGEYKVAIDNACGTSQDSLTIIVHELPKAPLIIKDEADFVVDDASVEISSVIQWYLNDAILSQATGRKITPDTIGNYHVKVTDINGCSNTSNILIRDAILGLTFITESKMTVAPNPSTGMVTITFAHVPKGDVKVTLSDNQNQTVMSQSLSNSNMLTHTFDISENNAGIYFLRITGLETQFGQKIVLIK